MGQSINDMLNGLMSSAPAATDDFGTFDTRKRHSDVIREGEDTNVLEDVGNWFGDVWQNTITSVPEEESGISNQGAPEPMQSVLAHVPNDSKPYAIKQALKNFYPEANAGGHSFDVFQDENSGKWVYTDPNTAKPTWIEPPGIEWGDWGDDSAVMALETAGSGAGGTLGAITPIPGGMVMGAAIGSGIATGSYTYSELRDLLDAGYLDPEIYGTSAHPNESALNGEVSSQAAISAAGSVVGDTVILAGKKGFNKLIQTKAFRIKFPKHADRALIQDSLNSAIRIQKGEFPLFSTDEWPLQTTASILKALARRQRIAVGDKVVSTSANKVATTAEEATASTVVKDALPGQTNDNQATFDNMSEDDAVNLEQLGFGSTTEQQKAAGVLGLDGYKVGRLERLSNNMEQLESSALDWKNADLLREKHQLRIENIHSRYTDILKQSGLSDNSVRTLGAQYLKQANNNIHTYLGERRVFESAEFGKEVTKTADDLGAIVDDLIKFTSDPAKANSTIKSTFGTAESHLDNRVNQAYKDILGDNFDSNAPIFDASAIQGDVVDEIRRLPKLFPELSGDTAFIKNLYRNLYDAKGNPRKLSWDQLDTEIKTLRSLKRAVWNAPTDKINKQRILDIEEGLLNWRYNTVKDTNGADVLDRLNEADSLTRAAHATFDSKIISSLVGDGAPIKEAKLFSLLTSDNIGAEDVFYIKNLMDSYVGTPISSRGPAQLTPIDKKDGQDLYEAVRIAFYNDYRKKVLKETNLGDAMDIVGVDKKVEMSKEAAHNDWMATHSEYLGKWLDPEDVANFQDAGALSNKLRAESAVLKDIQKTSGMQNKNAVFQKTYGAGSDKYGSSEEVWLTMHNADGSPKPGAEQHIRDYQRMVFNDMNDKILQTNLKQDPNITGHAYIDLQSIDNYIRKHEDVMTLWLGPDKMREVRKVRDMAELATTWRTRHKDDSNNQLSKMLNDGLRAYVGMFTRTGRMLTAVKRFKGRGEDTALMETLLDAEVAAKRMNTLERSRIMTMMHTVGSRPAGRAMERDPVDETNISDTQSGVPAPKPKYDLDWDSIRKGTQDAFTQSTNDAKEGFTQDVDKFKRGFREGGLVHDYQLPTLKRPDYMDGMVEGYAEGGLVTQDQLQGMMQQMSGVQPTLQAAPIIPPLQEEAMQPQPQIQPQMQPASSTGVMSVVAQGATTMTKKQKEKAKIKAVKKGNKRHTMPLPPKTGILSGF